MARSEESAVVLRRRHVTRDRLLDAAAEVLAREGIQGASVEHICEQAGFTRGAFYSNFTSKDDLIMALFERERDAMVSRMTAAADPAGLDGLELAEVVASIMERFTVLHPADRDWFMAHREFELRGLRNDEVGRAFNDVNQQIRSEIERLIDTVLARFGYRLTISASHAATLLIGTYDQALRESLVAGVQLDTALLSRTIPTVLLSLVEPV